MIWMNSKNEYILQYLSDKKGIRISEDIQINIVCTRSFDENALLCVNNGDIIEIASNINNINYMTRYNIIRVNVELVMVWIIYN